MSATIAIIDDDDDLRETMCALLEAAGYQTAAFRDGREALDGMSGGRRPDVILLDLMMPRMNGWQFREAQLADAALASIPVVVMTARSTVADSPSLRDTPLLRKPFSVEELVAIIARQVGS
jgi:CheY-like chemotaxis protein